jgi:hypothetical protein
MDALERRIRSMGSEDAALLRDEISRVYPATSTKAAAIMAGADFNAAKAYRLDDNYDGAPFLETLRMARKGDPDANAAIKAVLGTSAATGQAIVPNNFVSGIVEWAAGENVYRQILTYTNVGNIAGVDVPYDRDEIRAALLQGAHGSNKECA